MGYTTDFWGEVRIEPPLNDEEKAYLTKFSETRRMKRTRGPYFVDGTGFAGQGDDEDILEYNHAPDGQPGLWCEWIPNEDGTAIVWNEGEKFYDAAEWMEYLVEHFLKPEPIAKGECPDEFAFLQGHICNGSIDAQGEDPDDSWILSVHDNTVEVVELTKVDTHPVLGLLREALTAGDPEWRDLVQLAIDTLTA